MPDGPNDRIVPDLRRRDLIGRAVAAGSEMAAGSSPSAADTRLLLTIGNDTELEIARPDLSNWHRWGAGDQLGTLNFITPQTRLAAAGQIRTGRVVPLGREISIATPNLRNFSYRMVRYTDPQPQEGGAYDVVGMTCHGSRSLMLMPCAMSSRRTAETTCTTATQSTI